MRRHFSRRQRFDNYVLNISREKNRPMTFAEVGIEAGLTMRDTERVIIRLLREGKIKVVIINELVYYVANKKTEPSWV